jgi:hypothetical protein
LSSINIIKYKTEKKFCQLLPNCKLRQACNTFYRNTNVRGISEARRIRWAGHVVRMGEKRNAYMILVGRPEGKRQLERPRRKRVDNIKINPREIECDGMDWIDLAQDRDQWRALVNMAM